MAASYQTRVAEILEALKTPRAAAAAGVIFALLYGTGLVLIRLSIPEDIGRDSSWLSENGGRITLALNLMPYAGIAFLWFIAAIRDRFGERKDQFFGTVFIGSGLLFVALSFASAALAAGLITSYTLMDGAIVASGTYAYGSSVMRNMVNIYAVRMAGVFMTSFGAVAMRTKVIGTPWIVATYVLAAVLLVTISFSLWVTLIFPAWVFALSTFFLLSGRRS